MDATARPATLAGDSCPRRRGWCASVGIAVLTLLVVSGESRAHDWQTEIIESLYNTGTYTSIAVDECNSPYISFFRSTDEQVRFARKDSTGWHVEVVATELGWNGGHTSLALDSLATPYISYFDYASGSIRWARRTGSFWHTETVDSLLTWGGWTSLAIDSNGDSHLSYVYYGPGVVDPVLRYACRDSSGWHVLTLNSLEVGLWTSLVLDSSGFPHITYHDAFGGWPGYIRHAHADSSGWHDEWIYPGEDYSSVAVDKNGRLHVSFEFISLYYAYYHDASGWQVSMVDGPGAAGSYSSIAVDGSARPQIAYYHDTEQRLKYLRGSPTGFQVEGVDSDGDVGRYVSLALDSNEHAHVSYYDGTNSALKYAYGVPTIDLTASLQGATLVLTWTAYPGALGYWVYGATNDAHFTPGFAPAFEHRLAVLLPMTLSWSTPAGLGDPDSNWTYLILAVDGAGQELRRSNRAGEHDFVADTGQ